MTTLTRRSFIRVALMATALSGCAPASGDPQPPEIAYGRDMCDSCGMIIDDPRFAAATVGADGRTRKFDDMGEMFGFHAARQELAVRAWFVHDFPSRKWINAAGATFVVARDVMTPMGSGVAAFLDHAEATAFANARGGRILSFDEARASLRSGR